MSQVLSLGSISSKDSPRGDEWLGGDWKSVAICHGRFTREAICRRREHGGGVSCSADEDSEEADEAVRDLEDEAVEEVMSSFVAICKLCSYILTMKALEICTFPHDSWDMSSYT